MGFDRLVAMASEVDKRRKSTENSPAHNNQPRKGAEAGPKDPPRPGSDIRMLQVDKKQYLFNKIIWRDGQFMDQIQLHYRSH